MRIETGRYSNPSIPHSERFCPCCNATDIEDSYHFFYGHAITKLDRDFFFPFCCLYIFEIVNLCLSLPELLKSQDKNIIKKKTRSASNMRNDWKSYNP